MNLFLASLLGAVTKLLLLFFSHLSRVWLCDPMNHSMPGFPVLHYHPGGLLKPMSIESVMPSNRLIIYCPLLLLPSIFPSISVFSNESALHVRCPFIGASKSVLSMSIQDWFPLGLTGFISLLSKGLTRVFSSITIQKYSLRKENLPSGMLK